MLVTVAGAGGFIGGHLTQQLLDDGYEVKAVDLKPLSQWYQVHEEAYNHPDVDLRYESNCVLACYNASDVYNLAADMGGMGFIASHRIDCMESVLITTNMLKAALRSRVGHFFYASSACVYPDFLQRREHVSLKESDAWPADPEPGYGMEKLFGEELAKFYRQETELHTVVARFHNIFGPCFDDQTEVLTDSGWKLFADLSSSDKILSLNSENGMMFYQTPVAYQAYPYKGKMFQTRSSSVDHLVTPNHMSYVKTPSEDSFRLVKTSDIKWDRARLDYSSYGHWTGFTLDECFVLPETFMTDGRRLHKAKSVAMKDWFDFAGWYISEGSSWVTDRNYTVCITQNPGEFHEEIKAVISRLGYACNSNGNNIIVSNKQLYEAVQCFGTGCRNKRIPRWMLQASGSLLTILFESLMKGDGDKDGGRYSTSSPGLADDFQELALKLGFRCHYKQDSDDCFRLSIVNTQKSNTKRHHRTLVDYDGMVYDVTLPDHHILMVRRNGKPVWSGNCGTYKGGREKAPAAICRKVAEAKLTGSNDIEIWGDGEQTRSFLYVDECVEGIFRIMEYNYFLPLEQQVPILNLGSDELVSINDLVAMVEDIAGVTLNRVYNLDAPQGVRGRNSDNVLIKELLDWAPSASLRSGLEKTYEWVWNELLYSI